MHDVGRDSAAIRARVTMDGGPRTGTAVRRTFLAFAVIMLGSVGLAQNASETLTLDTLAAIVTDFSALLESGAEGLDAATRDRLVPGIAAWVEDIRDDALARGVEHIPRDVRTALEGHVPPQVLDVVRWRIDGDVAIAGQSLFQLGGVRAVTLGNVILFADADEATDMTLWAHELFHVMQFAEWGVDGFVDRYLVDRHAVEHEAWEFRWAWMKATGRVPSA